MPKHTDTRIFTGPILATPGYDPQSGLMYAPRHPVTLTVPDNPTRGNAEQAAVELLDVVSEFPLVADHHRAAWLASLLTPLARYAFRGCSPLFLAEGNVAGCGKGLLTDTVSLIVRGDSFAITTMPKEGDELRKLVTSMLIRGTPLVLFDNVSGRLGGPDLDALLTSPTWSGRVLGESRTIEVPNLTVWFATGNNVAVTGDTLRRVCPIRLESNEERPEDRTDIRRKNLKEWVGAERPRLLTAALTILRAYHLAGRPSMSLPAWGSFDDWSNLIRGAIVWAGCPDPWQGRQAMREDRGDDQIHAMGGLLRLWPAIDPHGSGLTTANIIQRVDALPSHHELVEVMLTLIGGKSDPGKPDARAKKLGYLVRQFDRRMIGGRRLVKAGESAGVRRWCVESLDVAAQPAQPASFIDLTVVDGVDVSNPTRGTEEHIFNNHTHMDAAETSTPSTPSTTVKGRKRVANDDRPMEMRDGGRL